MNADSYINRVQWTQLLAPINPNRVGTKDNLSHVEAYDVRAHLNRIFGFGRWSEDTIDVTMLYEQSKEEQGGTRWRAAYRATVRLTVNAPDGTLLATYTEAAVGTNFGWLPDSKRDETHDMAIKTAASQALKRCAINLGDQFGLSLYNKGSRLALVGGTIVAPGPDKTPTAHEDVTEHITEQLAPEDSPAREQEPDTHPPDAPPGQVTDQWSTIIRNRVVDEAPKKTAGNARKAFLLKQLAEAGSKGVAGAMVVDGDGRGVFLEKLIQDAIKDAA